MAYFSVLVIILKLISSRGHEFEGIQGRPMGVSPKLGMSGGFFEEFGVPAVMSMSSGDGCHSSAKTVGGDGGGTEFRECEKPPIFCETTSCCLPSGRCGCIGGGGGGDDCEDVKSFQVKLATCTFDGLRVRVDFQVGIRRGTCDDFGIATETVMEMDEEGDMGIRLRTTHCWNATTALDVAGHLASFAGNDDVVLVGISVRIEDPDSYLVEKFLLRILENLDLMSVAEEFGTDEWVGGDNRDHSGYAEQVDWRKWREFISSRNLTGDTVNKNSTRWGCQPDPSQNTVVMDSGFSSAALLAIPANTGRCTDDGICESPPIPCPNSSCCFPKLNQNSANSVWNGNCGCHDNRTGTCENVNSFEAGWKEKTEDGMVVRAEVSNYFPLSPEECGSDEASVVLEPNQRSEWSLTISISQCIRIPGHQYRNPTTNPSGLPTYGRENGDTIDKNPMRYIGNLKICEGTIYKRMLTVAKQFIAKRMKKGGKRNLI